MKAATSLRLSCGRWLTNHSRSDRRPACCPRAGRPRLRRTTMKHLTSLLNLTVDEVREILQLAHNLKAGWRRGERPALLQGRYLTQVFEKPSLRTRVSFDAAIAQLGGRGVFLSGADAGLTGRESLADVARVISSYSDAVVLRTF